VPSVANPERLAPAQTTIGTHKKPEFGEGINSNPVAVEADSEDEMCQFRRIRLRKISTIAPQVAPEIADMLRVAAEVVSLSEQQIAEPLDGELQQALHRINPRLQACLEETPEQGPSGAVFYEANFAGFNRIASEDRVNPLQRIVPPDSPNTLESQLEKQFQKALDELKTRVQRGDAVNRLSAVGPR
jgi:hypothetical protein